MVNTHILLVSAVQRSDKDTHVLRHVDARHIEECQNHYYVGYKKPEL